MSIKINCGDNECELESSKFFGEILLPEKWLIEDVFSPDELFFCQINLEELYEAVGKTLLPSSGILYFFINYGKKMQGIVRYTCDEVDAYTCFNEDWESDYDVVTEWPMEFTKGDEGTLLLTKDKNVGEDEIALLKYVPDSLDIDYLTGDKKSLYFIIKEYDLKNKDFSKAYIKIV